MLMGTGLFNYAGAVALDPPSFTWTPSTTSAVSSISVDPTSGIAQLVCQASTGSRATCGGNDILPGHTWGDSRLCWISCGSAVYGRSVYQVRPSGARACAGACLVTACGLSWVPRPCVTFLWYAIFLCYS